MDVSTTQPGQAFLGRVLQVVGSFIIDHHDQNKPRLYVIDVLCKTMALVLTAVCVKPVEAIRRLNQQHVLHPIILTIETTK